MVQAYGGVRPVARAAFEAIQEHFRAAIADLRARGKNMKSAERPFRRIQKARPEQIAKSDRPSRFHIQHAQFLRRARSEIEVQSAGVIVLAGRRGCEKRRKIAWVCFGRCQNEDRQFRRRLFCARERQEVIFSVELEIGRLAIRDH